MSRHEYSVSYDAQYPVNKFNILNVLNNQNIMLDLIKDIWYKHES